MFMLYWDIKCIEHWYMAPFPLEWVGGQSYNIIAHSWKFGSYFLNYLHYDLLSNLYRSCTTTWDASYDARNSNVNVGFFPKPEIEFNEKWEQCLKMQMGFLILHY